MEDLNAYNIVLSSRDMRALVTQILADSPTSLRPSHTSLNFFLDVNSMFTSTSSPVFRLSSVDTGPRLFFFSLNIYHDISVLRLKDRYDLRVLVDFPALRAPEVILGAPSDSSTDLWSLGCIVRFAFPSHPLLPITLNTQLYEILTGERLFDPSFQTEELGLSIEESHLIQMIELFGGFPLDLLRVGEYSSRWFTEFGTYIP